MKRILTLLVVGAFAFSSTNCTTTYDAYGNPRQSVDPGAAVAGAAAAGILGYAIANNNNDKKYYRNNYNYYDRGGYRYNKHRNHYDRRGRYSRY